MRWLGVVRLLQAELRDLSSCSPVYLLVLKVLKQHSVYSKNRLKNWGPSIPSPQTLGFFQAGTAPPFPGHQSTLHRMVHSN